MSLTNTSARAIAGLILAAGESCRMGSPKALLPFRGATFLETLIQLFSAHCNPVIVVLGAHADEIRAARTIGLRPVDPDERNSSAEDPLFATGRGTLSTVRAVYNPNYASGQTSSLQTGLRAVPSDADGVLFTLVDHPAVSAETIDALLARPHPLIRIPRYVGERGHPIWFRRDLTPEFLALPVGAAANQVVRAHRSETEFIDVPDLGVVADIDDPAAYRELLRSSSGSGE